ncbi:hypothetical protein BDZ89DRAFT_1077670, partial [Hymenopellis radicata]
MGGGHSSPPANAKRKPIPLPPQVDGDISIHPLFLGLDLALYRRPQVHAHELATDPPLPSMTLVFIRANGEWDIYTVHGSGELGHVLADDVLCGVRVLLARQSALGAESKGRLVKMEDIGDVWELV